MDEDIPTPRLTGQIVRAWEQGESDVIGVIEEFKVPASETFVTEFLIAAVNRRLQAASTSGAIAGALTDDLRNWAVGRISLNFSIPGFAKGLVAEVVQHSPNREADTGADFGLIYTRPTIHLNRNETYLTLPSRQDGLLVQAKRQNTRGKFRDFNENQAAELPYATSYLGLYLYGRSELAPISFGWVADRRKKFEQFYEALRERSPKTRGSAEIIRGLAEGKLGTSDPNIIRDSIGPAERSWFEVQVDWREGERPDPRSLHIIRYAQQRTKQVQQIRVSRS